MIDMSVKEIAYDFDASYERIENSFEELMFALGTEDKEAVEEELYRKIGERMSQEQDWEATSHELGELVDQNSEDVFNYLTACYAQNLGALLEEDDELREGFYEQPLEDRMSYMQLGRWTNGSPVEFE